MSMRCPYCGVGAYTLETRTDKDANKKYRRHECTKGHRFNSVQEVIDTPIPWRVRKTRDGIQR